MAAFVSKPKRVEISSLKLDCRVLHFIHLWPSEAPVGKRENTDVIRRVILGARVDEKLEETIVGVLKAPDLEHVKLERVVLCEKGFATRTVPVPR